MRLLALIAIFSVVSSVALPAFSAVSNVIKQVQPATRNSYIKPADAIIFDIADDVTDERINRFFLDFDGEDVTPSVQLDGRRVSYQPESRLPVGDHLVKLFEHVGNENYTEIARFIVRVGGENGQDNQIYGNFSGQYNLLAAERTADGLAKPELHSGQAFLETKALAGGSDWDMKLKANGNFDSITENNYDDEHLQLGEYLFTGRSFSEHGNAMLRMGNHNTGISNLLMDKFYRRGGSLQIEALDHVRLIGFSQDPARAIGSTNASGVAEDDERVNGGQLQFYPLGLDEHFWLEGGFVDGEGRERRRGDALIDNIYRSGKGWNIGGEWQGFKDHTRLRGEFTNTDFDYDGRGTVTAPIEDHAWRGVGSLALLGDLNPATYDKTMWSLTLDQKRVGTYFHSLTNAAYPSDQKRVSLTSDFVDESLSIVADGYVMKNNVNDLFDIPTDKTLGGSIQTSVTPNYFGFNSEDFSWFGASVFTAGAYTSNSFRDKTPAGFFGDNMRYHNSGANIGWSATFEEATLSLTHTYTEYRDKIFSSENQDSHLSEIAVSFTPSERFSWSPSLQHERLRYESADEQSNYFAGLDINYEIIKDVLSNHSYGSMQLNDSGNQEKQYNASTEFFWTMLQAKRNAPGYGLGLNGQYQNVYDHSGTRNDIGSQYKIYASLKINAPFGW